MLHIHYQNCPLLSSLAFSFTALLQSFLQTQKIFQPRIASLMAQASFQLFTLQLFLMSFFKLAFPLFSSQFPSLLLLSLACKQALNRQSLILKFKALSLSSSSIQRWTQSISQGEFRLILSLLQLFHLSLAKHRQRDSFLVQDNLVYFLFSKFSWLKSA